MSDSQVKDPVTQFATGVWWWVLLRGVFAVIFGIVAVIAPFAALTALAVVFGVYAIVDGIVEIVHAVQVRKDYRYWGWLLAEGIVSLLAGILVLVLPFVAAAVGGLIVLWTIVIWSLIGGAMRLRSTAGAEGASKTWAIISGLVSIVFAIVLAVMIFVTPGATLLGLAWAIGVFAIAFGVALVIAAFQVRAALKR